MRISGLRLLAMIALLCMFCAPARSAQQQDSVSQAPASAASQSTPAPSAQDQAKAAKKAQKKAARKEEKRAQKKTEKRAQKKQGKKSAAASGKPRATCGDGTIAYDSIGAGKPTRSSDLCKGHGGVSTLIN